MGVFCVWSHEVGDPPSIVHCDIYSVAAKLPQWNNCAFYDKRMKLLPLLVHTLRFILRYGGKLDLTPADL